jgi:hypothetical protein
VLSGDVPSDCNLASFRQARFFDFFNEIGAALPLDTTATNDEVCPPFPTFAPMVSNGSGGWQAADHPALSDMASVEP